jgi:hypothetical protein
MTQSIFVGIGAGLAAALLFLAPASGTVLAFPLFALSGLPIAIAGLGWGVFGGVVAAAVGTLGVLALTHWAGAALFALIFGAPLAFLARLANLSRPLGSDGGREWYPLGRLLLAAAVAVTGGLWIIGGIVGFDPQALVHEMTTALSQWIAGANPAGEPPTAAEIEPFARLNVALLPFISAVIALVVIVTDLWLAALVTRTSGRLQRPRDPLWMVALPNQAAGVLAVTVALAFFPGTIGHAAAVAAGAVAAAMALVGLAVLHALTAGMAGRAAILVITYVLVFLSGFPIVLFAALGVGEGFLHLRERRFGGGNAR